MEMAALYRELWNGISQEEYFPQKKISVNKMVCGL
jgi:hypothetical protein